ncbi:uncharacterized protein VP01_913g2 [Puccinia sorghi]|uniref:Uncharacterized protein n=1 Tax=Puccinia sorghi TaxID=27349 RepID=A0A0L6U9M5_9BASI|nr:uncharacterized protein VP01_913g2 [Puccinia sorghi]
MRVKIESKIFGENDDRRQLRSSALTHHTAAPEANNQEAQTSTTDAPGRFLEISLLSTDLDNSDYIDVEVGPFEAPINCAVFDAEILVYVNQHLPCIKIPTCISGAIPVLGKASYATPLRHSLVEQQGPQYSPKCLKNFAHLVSMVNLALKHTMSSNIINGCFRIVHLLPTITCLFTSRSAWDGLLLKPSTTIALVGQLETTFLTTYLRSANLQALLKTKDLPSSLSSLVSKSTDTLPSLLPPLPDRSGRLPALSDEVLHLLLYHQLPRAEHALFYPVLGKYCPLSTDSHKNNAYSTSNVNTKNSVVKLDSTFPDDQQFGHIESIFEHRYQLRDSINSQIWFLICPFPPIPVYKKNPFRDLNSFTMQVELRLPPANETNCLIV